MESLLERHSWLCGCDASMTRGGNRKDSQTGWRSMRSEEKSAEERHSRKQTTREVDWDSGTLSEDTHRIEDAVASTEELD